MKRDEENQSAEEEEQERPHAFWSGIIAFGLVSLPVSLFPAHSGKLTLKMVDAHGALLRRQFFCDVDNRPLERDDIVRGYEIEKDRFVEVEDEELEALEPERSHEIDLKRFVPLTTINPIYFERAYFLVPDSDTTKAYRLLAKSMEDEQKAGIATFVMRGKSYLVAIIAERGILRAETLRYLDELRTPEQIGLPPRQHPDKNVLAPMRTAIGKLLRKQLDLKQLSDQQTERLMQLVEKKLKSGRDLLPAPEPDEVEAESNVIDLMQVLKERLQGRVPEVSQPKKRATRPGKRLSLQRRSKHALYEEAQELDIAGRSKMSRQQLIEAIDRAHK